MSSNNMKKGCFYYFVRFFFIYPLALGVLLYPYKLMSKVDNPILQDGFFFIYTGILLLALVYYIIRYFRKKGKNKKNNKFKESVNAITLNTQKSSIVINNPFRGFFVLGAAGSGKSESIGVPLLEQFIQKDFCGIVYDFKFPTLANDVAYFITANRNKRECNLKHYYLNFNNPASSHRVNPLNPKYLPNTSYAREYAQAIISNLMKESISKPDFWSRSATDVLTACIWYLKEEQPQMCDLPHVFAMITSDDIALVNKLQENPISQQMTMSLYNAMQREADNQVAGVIGTLQGIIAQINTPELMYIFGADDFSLDVNDPTNPSIVTVGSYPTLTTTFAPLCSLVITVATKLMNQPNKNPSFVLLDEAPTVFIPNVEVLPNTGRSNKIATVLMCQDLAQLADGYGKDKADVLFAACNNHFYGRVASSKTSEILSRQFGKEDKTYITSNTGSSQGSSFSRNKGTSESIQERDLLKPSEFLTLDVGEFAGIVVESNTSMFKKHFLQTYRMPLQLINNETNYNEDINCFYRSVREDINNLLGLGCNSQK